MEYAVVKRLNRENKGITKIINEKIKDLKLFSAEKQVIIMHTV